MRYRTDDAIKRRYPFAKALGLRLIHFRDLVGIASVGIVMH